MKPASSSHSHSWLPVAGKKFAIVESQYHEEFVRPMADAAVAEIQKADPQGTVERFVSPGSFEIPVLVQGVLQTGIYHAVLALGLIWRGETAHADLIARSITDGLMRLALDSGCPVIHEVLLIDNKAQARARCLPGDNNRGIEAARAALQAVAELEAIKRRAQLSLTEITSSEIVTSN